MTTKATYAENNGSKTEDSNNGMIAICRLEEYGS